MSRCGVIWGLVAGASFASYQLRIVGWVAGTTPKPWHAAFFDRPSVLISPQPGRLFGRPPCRYGLPRSVFSSYNRSGAVGVRELIVYSTRALGVGCTAVAHNPPLSRGCGSISAQLASLSGRASNRVWGNRICRATASVAPAKLPVWANSHRRRRYSLAATPRYQRSWPCGHTTATSPVVFRPRSRTSFAGQSLGRFGLIRSP